jgi:hypothetical protein
MKAIQADRLGTLSYAAAAVLLACGTSAERSIVGADGEIFESVVRSQLVDSSQPPRVATSALRFDSRPAGDNTDLVSTPDRPRQLDLAAPSDSLSSDALSAVVEQRKDILKSIGVEEGGPFNYPDCGGTRTRRARDSTGILPPPKCPTVARRYVTVGLPYRGAASILAKVRPAIFPPPDSTGEQWTVLVTESLVGPGGQQWRQYVSLFRRDPDSGRLGLVERFLLSWAE